MSIGRITAAGYLAVSLAVTYIAFGSPAAIADPGPGDLPYFAVLALHYVWGAALLLASAGPSTVRKSVVHRMLSGTEVLGAISLLLFLFTFIFALNANMDYVQRFIQSGGNLRLALDTRTEQRLAWLRLFPLVGLDLGTWLLVRVARPSLVRAAGAGGDRRQSPVVRVWSFALTLLSAFLVAIAMPSFLSLEGFPPLAWIAFVPLFLVFRSARIGHGVFYGAVFGTFTTLVSSYWLGTFSLVSLQITVLFFLIYYLIFTPLTLLIYRAVRWGRFLVFPFAFTLFEYLRSIGFLGYPWALAAHSQYAVLPLIQVAAVTGVWGVSFLVLLANSAIAEWLGAVIERRSARPAVRHLAAVAVLTSAIAAGGAIVLARSAAPDTDARRITVAQIQQNNDPRKSDYEQTFQTLASLTDSTLDSEPDLVVWSETAFVPNIRRWAEDDSFRRFHRLVVEFLEYQRDLGTWLLTGNDDYEVITDEQGREIERNHYNAAVLFDPEGRRRETYRKIRLVPFTEHFPYRRQLPWVYELLLDFDVHFWAEGIEPTVFEHPLVRFSTPICYEDVFPGFVRGFVLDGAELILNISNDYWSLAEAQAKQHFVAGLFRAIENRRPVLRTTASGLTGSIDPYGRILTTAPYFQEVALVTEVRIPPLRTTIYTRLGDYFPLLCGLGLAMLLAVSLLRSGARRCRRGPNGSQRRTDPGQTHPDAEQDLLHAGGVPPGQQAFAGNAPCAGLLPVEQDQGDVAQSREVLRGVILALAALVFTEGSVEYPVQRGLDTPVRSNRSRQRVVACPSMIRCDFTAQIRRGP